MSVLTLVVRVMIFVRSVPSFNENDFFFFFPYKDVLKVIMVWASFRSSKC